MNALIPDPYTIPLDQLDPSDARLFELSSTKNIE